MTTNHERTRTTHHCNVAFKKYKVPQTNGQFPIQYSDYHRSEISQSTVDGVWSQDGGDMRLIYKIPSKSVHLEDLEVDGG